MAFITSALAKINNSSHTFFRNMKKCGRWSRCKVLRSNILSSQAGAPGRGRGGGGPSTLAQNQGRSQGGG